MSRSLVAAVAAAALLVPAAAAKDEPHKHKEYAPPTAPTALIAFPVRSFVVLIWRPARGNEDVEGYGIYVDGLRVASTERSFYLVPAPCGTTRRYGVDAFDERGNRSAQTTVSATTLPCPAPSPPSQLTATPTAAGIALAWRAPTDARVTGYGVYLDGQLVASPTGTTAVVPVPCGTRHDFAVDAVGPGGLRSAKATVSATALPCPPPPSPTGLTTTPATTSIGLTWQPSAGATGYEVSVDGAVVATVTATSYTAGGLACGTEHDFAVVAVGPTGRSERATAHASTQHCEGGGDAVYVAPAGSDANACTLVAPCASFDRAYRVALPGWHVKLMGGTYPTQLIAADPTKLTAVADVVFEPASSAPVEIAGDLVMMGSHAVFENFKLRKLLNDVPDSAPAGTPLTSHDVTYENLHGETFNIGPAYRITIKGGDWGPSIFCYPRNDPGHPDPATWCPAGSPYAATGNTAGGAENHVGPNGGIMNQWPHDIVIDGARIHDQNSLDLDALHTGGLFLTSGFNITIRNSIFQNNAVYDIQVQNFTGGSPLCCGMDFGPVHDLTLENNWFGTAVLGINEPGTDRSDHQSDVQMDVRDNACWENVLIRFNSFTNGVNVGQDNPPCFKNVRVVGNLGGPSDCFPGKPGLTWEYNAWVGATCGPTDVSIASLPYVSTKIGSEDYHLTGGPAVDLVTGTGADEQLATDIDGDPRPIGPARDAGADEK